MILALLFLHLTHAREAVHIQRYQQFFYTIHENGQTRDYFVPIPNRSTRDQVLEIINAQPSSPGVQFHWEDRPGKFV